MAMEEALVARLSGAAPIAALVGDRVDWFDRPNAMPAITLTKVSPGREWTHEGPDGLERPRVQVDSWSTTKAGAALLARGVRAELEQAAAVDGVSFAPALVELELWSRDDDLPGGEPVFRVQQDFIFYHWEL